MIVHELRAENFLKYRHLSLDNLPSSGLVAISGANESGKSSIGETLCFALFGRSFAVDVDNLEKLIRWSESDCSVEMEFSGKDGKRYRVLRMLDRDGNHSARLSLADRPEEPIARGVDVVAESMYNILGFAYAEFVESFYLAQREITAPHPHSYALKIMAGVAPLEFCRGEFADDLEREQEAVEVAESKLAEVDGQMEALGFDEEALDAAEQRRKQLDDMDRDLSRQADSLARAAEEFHEHEPRLRKAESARGTAAGLRLLFLLLALTALGLWGLLTQAAHLPVSQQLAELLQQNISVWNRFGPDWLLYGGVGSALLFLIFWGRAGSLSGRIADLQGAGRRLREELAALDGLEAAFPDIAVPDGEAASRLDPEVREHLGRRLEDGGAGTQEVATAVEREAAWLSATRESVRALMAEADQTLAEQRVRQEEFNKLQGMRDAFEQQADDHRHRMVLRELADELLLGASRHLSYRFNHNLRNQVSKTLPLFTEGRYEHLQIDEDLTVRAFSKEKQDFMDLDEISSGTQRQIMLAVRLALAQELVNRAVKGKQFIFLDEPFAFFDEARTRSALNVLPRLSDDLEQVWIVAQEFPQGASFDVHIHCDRDADSYRAGGG
jgi:exonuclease SbcC